MRDEDIVRMTNQIAAFFQPYGRDEAVAGVAGHIRSFWEQRMRAALADLVQRDPDRLDPVVRDAALSLGAST
ncbi:formate dehydrogenase subunit delta [Hyphobacterium sp. HN65]|uniref:Formate dehydrogenase subunit delta n=1 Tax=Hyphobacterium lacteum TaxID=3116575 RepID=A0ABU7LSF1_9PROT|nr:formate dehydrogenase subunit delta [Hyphobacterium sp. HN65]MEE2526800.1 formate dehydrogenase subunit delta [Hyphobacterium sp. HN65]